MKFGEKLKELRLRKDYSLYDVGEKVIDILNKTFYNKNIEKFFKSYIIKKFIKRRRNGRNKRICLRNR